MRKVALQGTAIVISNMLEGVEIMLFGSFYSWDGWYELLK